MFDSLRDAFREAVRNFKTELDRDRVPEEVDRLLHGMKSEVAEEKARLRGLEDDIRRASAEAAREAAEAETCRRREKMAKGIGDEETARLAREYAERHERRHEVLAQKVKALEQELEVRTAEVERMIERIREAQKQRDALTASAGRTRARETLRGGDDLFDELDRMADRMGPPGQGGAPPSPDDDVGAWESDLGQSAPPPPPPGGNLDERLAELKKKMGRE